jgi:mannose-6-phosphate isomerase-like protein (cupin superfamily)
MTLTSNTIMQFIRTGTGEIFTIGPITVRVLEDGSHTDNRVGAVEIIVPPVTDQTPLHLHRMHDETFLVRKGAIRFNTGDKNFDAQAGDYVVIPVGVAHTFSNPFGDTAVFFNTFSPAYYVNYLRELSGFANTGQLTAQNILRIMAHYATEPG